MGAEAVDESEAALDAALSAFKEREMGVARDRALLREGAVRDLLSAAKVSITVTDRGEIKYTVPSDEDDQGHSASTWRVMVFTLQAASLKFPGDKEMTSALERVTAFFDRVAGCDAVCVARGVREEHLTR